LSEFVKIGDLNPSSRGVNLIAKVVSKTEPRVVGSQYDSAEHKLSTALIADESGAISLVLWDDDVERVREGETIRITNAYVKVFKGRMQLNLGRYGKVEASDVELEEVNTENNLSEKVVSSPGFSGSGPRERFQRKRTFGRRSRF
jgi:replication factor A1